MKINKNDWVVIKISFDETRNQELYDAFKHIGSDMPLEMVVQFKNIEKIKAFPDISEDHVTHDPYDDCDCEEKEYSAFVFELPAEPEKIEILCTQNPSLGEGLVHTGKKCCREREIWLKENASEQ